MADYLPPVVAKLTGDDGGLTRVLAASKDKVKRWAIEVGKTKVTLTVDAKLRDGTLAEIRRRVAESPAAKLKVDLQLGAGQTEAIRRRLADREVEVKVKPVMDAVALRRVQVVLMELGRPITVSVRPGMDDAAQRRAQGRLDRLSRDRTVIIRTRVIGGGVPAAAGGSGSGALGAILPLAPALVPIAASATRVAASIGAATAAVGVFGLAVLPQIKSLGAAATAWQKYDAAVAKYGSGSQQAAAAQQAISTALDGMPPATQRAAMAFLGLKNQFTSWSDGLSRFTMAPVEHSFVVVEGILPRLSPMVKDVSGQLDRLMTVAAGGVQTPGFDSLMSRFTAFADGALRRGVDDVIHFSRVLSEGGGGRGAFGQFMAYAKEEGPAVRETLRNIGQAVSTILQGSAQAGPGMLSLVNAVAKLVAALPPEFVGRAMQVYAVLKLYKLASAGITGVAGSITTLSGRLTVLRTTSAAAGGGVAGVRAALASLSTGAKIGGAIALIAGVALALHELASSSKAAPDVDKMTTALGEFGRTGAVTGVLKGDLKDLSESIAMVSKTASGNKFVQAASDFGTWVGIAKGPGVSDAKKNVDSLDKSLAALVTGGHSDLAAAASARLEKAWIAGGGTAKRYTATMNDYQSALADVKFQTELTAQAQGAFGAQAIQVQQKLDKQKSAAQGLQQAILDLNDANRAAMDSESAYQQAIDDATKAIKDHRDALKMSHGQLDLNSQAARDAYGPLSQLAAAAEANAVAVYQQTGSQDKANRVLIDAHDRLVRLAGQMGLNTRDANRFADSLDNIRDPKIQVTANIDSAQAAADTIQRHITQLSKMKATPRVRADLGRSEAELANLRQQIAGLRDKSVFVTLKVGTSGMPADVRNLYGFGAAAGAVVAGGVRRMAEGGMGRPAMMARGGTSVLWAEGPDESYIPHDRRPRSRAIAEKTVSIMGGAVNWGGSGGSGGSPAASAVPMGVQVAKGLWSGMDSQAAWLAAEARKFATRTIPVPMAEALGINSPSRVAIALGRWVGAGMVQGLTGSTASVKSATLRLTRSIEQVFRDDLRVDIRQQQHTLGEYSSVSRFVAADNARLIKLAAQRDTVAGKLKAAESKLWDLKRQWADEKNQVASQILQGASVVTSAPQPGFALTAGDVVNNLKDQAAKAAQFAAQLQALKAKGLGADLIAQIAASGVDQGGATALALSTASKAQIDQLNTTQKGLNKAAEATGKTVADKMYGAGLMSARGLVKGLQSQEKAIAAEMLKIAKSMEKAIKQALGIKSPSTVMAQLGEFSGRGMAVGIDRSAKHVRIAAQGLAMATRQGAAYHRTGLTGLAPGRTASHPGGSYRGGDTYVYVTVQGNVTTERNLVDAVEAGLTQRARRNPGGLRPVNPWNGSR